MGFKVIKKNILSSNDNAAEMIRADLSGAKTLMINIISSPGSGKTAFLEKAGPKLKEEGVSFTIVTGDCYTSRDAERLDAVGLPVAQINTGGACHLNAQLVEKSLEGVDLDNTDLIIVENVGNLVCPTFFDLGEDIKIAFMSTTEGHDKPVKYPMLIRESALAVINKIDLIEFTDFDMAFCERSLNDLNRDIKILKMSCKTGEGIDSFIDWIKAEIQKKKENQI
jgi:hydrogenase nickel incorporation protein HypB